MFCIQMYDLQKCGLSFIFSVLFFEEQKCFVLLKSSLAIFLSRNFHVNIF